MRADDLVAAFVMGLLAGILASILSGCGPPRPWASRSGLGWRWPEEPTVGYSTPELAQTTARALSEWRYGTLRGSCANVNVCVIVGTANHAGPRGDRCVAEVTPGPYWETVAHEIGHCLGIGHSEDPRSVMYPEIRSGTQEVTSNDRRTLATHE